MSKTTKADKTSFYSRSYFIRGDQIDLHNDGNIEGFFAQEILTGKFSL